MAETSELVQLTTNKPNRVWRVGGIQREDFKLGQRVRRRQFSRFRFNPRHACSCQSIVLVVIYVAADDLGRWIVIESEVMKVKANETARAYTKQYHPAWVEPQSLSIDDSTPNFSRTALSRCEEGSIQNTPHL